ncbi:MAG: NADH-quinone oxidoreductase subunit D [Deltaproteobacteria bacterium]|nr:NADH-quinone oxidoreductase subunit D [Deltaproteobacteria bacterium]
MQRSKIVDACRFLRDEPGLRFNLLMDLCGADYPGRDERYEVVYHLCSIPTKKRIRLKVRCPESDPTVPSIASLYQTVNWSEREAYDLFGIQFSGHPNLKRILCHHEFEGHALRKDYPYNKRGKIPTPDSLVDELHAEIERRRLERPAEERGEVRDLAADAMLLNIGPSHPAMHGCFRVLVDLDGERIRDSVAEIGYLHRCFEKESENHCYTQIIPYTDRLNYLSPLMNNVGYCMAVEKLLSIEIPERAVWIRVLICELSRIMDHLVCVGTNLVDLGALTNFWYFFNARERMIDWVEALCGARLTTNYTRIGGLMRDIPTNTNSFLRECLRELHKALRDVEGLTKTNRILMERTQGVGAITAEDAISFGFTGPCLRACGVDYDVRKAHPYYTYDQLDWDIPVGSRGDCYDRIFVRFEEMRQSARIIEQVLDRIPAGPIQTHDRRVALPPKHEVYGSIEGLMQHFKIIMHGIKPPAGEIYSYTEAANGELGFYIVSDGSSKPYRIKVRPPCYTLYQAYPELIRGGMIADAVAILGGLNIIAGELDR